MRQHTIYRFAISKLQDEVKQEIKLLETAEKENKKVSNDLSERQENVENLVRASLIWHKLSS
jgi:hypothetical protein